MRSGGSAGALVALALLLLAAGCGGTGGSDNAVPEASATVTDAYGTTCARADAKKDANGALICAENEGESGGSSLEGDDSSYSGPRITGANYELLVSDPDSYKGAPVSFVGRIFDVQRSADEIDLQVYADPRNDDWATIVATTDTSIHVSSDDYVRVVGTVQGAYSGQNSFGGDVSDPVIIADTVQNVSAIAAAPPAVSTLGRVSSSQAGVTVSVQRVDFAQSETRVLVFVRNDSASDVSFYDSSAKLVVGGAAVEQSYSGDYPELTSDLPPGSRTAGWIVFNAAANPEAHVDMYLEADSDDYNVGDYGVLKWHFNWQ